MARKVWGVGLKVILWILSLFLVAAAIYFIAVWFWLINLLWGHSPGSSSPSFSLPVIENVTKIEVISKETNGRRINEIRNSIEDPQKIGSIVDFLNPFHAYWTQDIFQPSFVKESMDDCTVELYRGDRLLEVFVIRQGRVFFKTDLSSTGYADRSVTDEKMKVFLDEVLPKERYSAKVLRKLILEQGKTLKVGSCAVTAQKIAGNDLYDVEVDMGDAIRRSKQGKYKVDAAGSILEVSLIEPEFAPKDCFEYKSPEKCWSKISQNQVLVLDSEYDSCGLKGGSE